MKETARNKPYIRRAEFIPDMWLCGYRGDSRSGCGLTATKAFQAFLSMNAPRGFAQ